MGKQTTIASEQACNTPCTLELEVEDTRTNDVVRRFFPQPFLVLGRGANTDLSLDDEAVSRRHVYLQVISGRVFCLDLQSRTGTHWDHSGPAPAGWLDPGRTVGLGPFRIRLASNSSKSPPETLKAWSPLVANSGAHEDLPRVTVTGTNEAGQPRTWGMNRVLALIGQSRSCKVRLSDPNASRICASLLRTVGGLWVIDLFGRPGIKVNGRPTRAARLHDGDELRLSKFSFKIAIADFPAPAPPATASAPTSLSAAESRADGDNAKGRNMVVSPWRAGSETVLDSVAPALSLAAITPTSPGSREALAALVEPVAQQFALMQRQMFEEFTQRMLLMGRMFGELHREQLGAVREELLRLQEVAAELRELQAALARGGAGARTDLAGSPQHRAAVPRRLEGPAAGLPGPGKTAPEIPPREMMGESGTAPSGGEQQVSPPPRKPPAAGAADQDLHATISQRILELQQEHETRWQKILSFLGGKSAR
jgi:pSer/pThr/pTyr-binding forkhead associated (FHA) protein